MNPDHQRLLDRLGEEDSFIERKPRDPNGREVWETIVAFANSVPEGRSGLIFVGVSNRGEILGIEDPDGSARKYHNVAKKYCYPAIDDPRPLYHSVPSGDRKLLVIEVFQSKRRPHFLGPAYVREGSQNLPAPDSLYQEMLTAHCGKAGQILKLKHSIVTVQHVGCELGRYEDFLPGHVVNPECRIEDCTPHDVRFTFNHTAYSVPLRLVDLAQDPVRHRLWKLIVRHPRA